MSANVPQRRNLISLAQQRVHCGSTSDNVDQPEGRRSAQGGRGGGGRKQMRDEVKGVEGTLLCIQHPEVSIILGRYGGYKVQSKVE